MPTFELTPQRSGAIAVTKYNEDGEHRGAVAVMEPDPRHGAVIRVPKAITLDGLEAILDRLRADHADLIDRWEGEAKAPVAVEKEIAQPAAEAEKAEAPPESAD